MTRISRLSKLIAILIALPYFRAQKHTSYLNISMMVTCVLRNGWFSFAHTQSSSHHYSTHAALPGYPYSLYSHITMLYIYYICSIKLYMFAQNFIAAQLSCCVVLRGRYSVIFSGSKFLTTYLGEKTADLRQKVHSPSLTTQRMEEMVYSGGKIVHDHCSM